jgi:hypothetical protein
VVSDLCLDPSQIVILHLLYKKEHFNKKEFSYEFGAGNLGVRGWTLWSQVLSFGLGHASII